MTDTIFEIYEKLCGIMTVSGYERQNAEKIADAVKEYAGGLFDRHEISPSGSVIFERDGASTSSTLLVDTHIDTVGMTVTEILDGGFLRCSGCGGIDSRILPSLEVDIHGSKRIRGIFCSVPPHLQKNCTEAPPISEMLIDTGKSKAELSELVKVGTPISYVTGGMRLCGEQNVISGAYLDDKLCAAAAIYGASLLAEHDPECGFILSLSSGEETNGGGALCAARKRAAAALVLDVNFATGKDVPEYVSAKIGNGISISYSAATSRRLTSLVENCAKRNSIPYKLIIETNDTGTNATRLSPAIFGTPCAIASIPIAYMHTPVETASLNDASCLSRLVCNFAMEFSGLSSEFVDRHYIKGGDAQ